jgi:hypothetical protein
MSIQIQGTTVIDDGRNLSVNNTDINGAVTQNIVQVYNGTIDCLYGNHFNIQVSNNTYLYIQNQPYAKSYSFLLQVNHSSGVIYWPSNVRWSNGIAPTLTTGKKHLFVFIYDDENNVWRGASIVNYTVG